MPWELMEAEAINGRDPECSALFSLAQLVKTAIDLSVRSQTVTVPGEIREELGLNETKLMEWKTVMALKRD